MAVYDILPQESLKWEDIRDTLNANGGSVDNNGLNAFKEAANINPFSKHKPVPYGVNFCQDFDSSKPNYVADWWKGSDGMCGLVPKKVSSRDAIISAQDGGMNGWSYDLPDGGSAQPFRLGDFAMYYPAANPPLFNFVISPETASKNETVTGSCMQNVESQHELTFADTGLSSCYFGMYLVHSNGTNKFFVTSALPLSDNGSEAELTNATLNTGTWTAYPCLSTVKYTAADAAEQVGDYYTLPMCNPVTFQVVAQKAYINCAAEWVTNDGIMNEIKVTSLSLTASSAVTYRNNYIQFRYSNSSFADAMQVGEYQIQLEDVEGATDFIFDTTGLNFTTLEGLNVGRDYKIIVSLGSGSLVTEILIMEDPSSPVE